MRISTFIILLILTGLNITQAQESNTFTLKKAQEYALQNSKNIMNAKLDVIKARKKVWETTANGLPQVNATVAYSYLPTIPEMPFSVPAYGVLQPDGKTVLIENMEVPIKLGVESSTTIDLTVSQLVFNGAYIVGLQASKVFRKFSEQSLDITENELKEGVANAYNLVLILENNTEILEKSKANIDTTLFELKQMFKEGFIEDTDVDQIQYTATTIKNSLKAIERQKEVAYMLLKFQMGMELDEKIILADNLEQLLDNINMEELNYDSYDITKNLSYQMLSTQVELQELNLKREKTSFLPTVAAFYNYQEKTERADFDFTIPHIIGLNVDVPIFSSGMRLSKVNQAKLELEKTRNTREQAIQGIKLEIEQARVTLLSAIENYKNEKANVALAEKIYNKTLLKYKEGISTSMELTQANTQYLTAQSNYFTAVSELLTAKNALDKLLNQN